MMMETTRFFSWLILADSLKRLLFFLQMGFRCLVNASLYWGNYMFFCLESKCMSVVSVYVYVAGIFVRFILACVVLWWFML